MLTGDAAFDTLNFDHIYHDAALPADTKEDILNKRMSEVVIHDSLDLAKLSCVTCRTSHEARALEHMLSLRGAALPKIVIEQRGSVFFRRGIFLDEIYAVEGVLYLKFHPPMVGTQDTYEVKITKVGEDRSHTFDLKAGGWKIGGFNAKPDTIWKVEIEGCLAYLGTVPSGPSAGRVV